MNVVILGSTGSVGRSAVDVCKHENHKVLALSCEKNIEILIEQYWELKPKFLAVESKEKLDILKEKLLGEDVILFGKGGAEKISSELDYDVLVNAIVGIAGLKSTYLAAKTGKRIALANKESLVVFGEELMKISKDHSTEIIPVDSEHSAIFQCLNGEEKNDVSKILLTASGGPFRTMSVNRRSKCKSKEALKHPNWSMGKKISIDSATMMNKGLEFIEAMRLFSVKPSQIEVLIHPESIVHSAVQFVDNSVIAQLSIPDMRLPIQYAINYPKRNFDSTFAIKELNFTDGLSLNFYKPDFQDFPCLEIAIRVADMGGLYPCILNAANEFAVEQYLNDKISFYGISNIISDALSLNYNGNSDNIDDIINCHNEVLTKCLEILKKY